MALFKGAGVALVTPMKENLDVDYGKLEEILEDQIKNGTDSIIITGTTGEAVPQSTACRGGRPIGCDALLQQSNPKRVGWLLYPSGKKCGYPHYHVQYPGQDGLQD